MQISSGPWKFLAAAALDAELRLGLQASRANAHQFSDVRTEPSCAAGHVKAYASLGWLADDDCAWSELRPQNGVSALGFSADSEFAFSLYGQRSLSVWPRLGRRKLESDLAQIAVCAEVVADDCGGVKGNVHSPVCGDVFAQFFVHRDKFRIRVSTSIGNAVPKDEVRCGGALLGASPASTDETPVRVFDPRPLGRRCASIRIARTRWASFGVVELLICNGAPAGEPGGLWHGYLSLPCKQESSLGYKQPSEAVSLDGALLVHPINRLPTLAATSCGEEMTYARNNHPATSPAHSRHESCKASRTLAENTLPMGFRGTDYAPQVRWADRVHGRGNCSVRARRRAAGATRGHGRLVASAEGEKVAIGVGIDSIFGPATTLSAPLGVTQF